MVRVFHDVGIVIIEPLRIASYLFGHLDGMNDTGTLCEVAPELPTEDHAFVTAIGRLVDQLRTLWGTRGKWESYNALVDVGAVCFRLFEDSACVRGRSRTGEPTSMSPLQQTLYLQGLRRLICCAHGWVAIGADGYL